MADRTPAPDVSLDAYLAVKPAPLVALVGLQNLHGLLTSRRLQPHPDEMAPRYISLEIETTFLDHQPSSGEDQESVILKRDWLHKHTHVIASVMCLWFDFGAGDTVNSIISALEGFRSRCRPNCKIVVVLVQGAREGPLSPGVDERLTTLRKAGELDPKSLFVLPAEGADEARKAEWEGAVRRLDKSLLDLSLTYYKDESRRNKKAKQLTTADKKAKPQARMGMDGVKYAVLKYAAKSRIVPRQVINGVAITKRSKNRQERCSVEPSSSLFLFSLVKSPSQQVTKSQCHYPMARSGFETAPVLHGRMPLCGV